VTEKKFRKIAFLIVMGHNSHKKNCFKTADPEMESLFFCVFVAEAVDSDGDVYPTVTKM
jgi:hypothetical protein